MKLFIFAAFFVTLTSAAPTVNEVATSDEEPLDVTEEFFPNSFKIYEGQHDIVKIIVPLNDLNFGDDTDDDNSDEHTDTNTFLFFVEADVNNGEVTDQGLYVRKNREVKKLLDNGRDADAPKGDYKAAFFAAKDGLYKYNSEKNEAEKYGAVDDELISLAVGNDTDVLYVLASDKNVYKVTDGGNKKVKVDDIKNAEQIVMDMSNNLFYMDSNKKVFMVNEAGVKEVTGVPETANKITLVRPAFIYDDGLPLIIDNKVYSVFANGTVQKESINIKVDSPITAYSVEGTILQFYGHNKKIYEFNILAIALGALLDELKEFIDGMKFDIQGVSQRSRTDFFKKSR